MFTYTKLTVTTYPKPVEPKRMDQQIPWWKSKTIWAGVAQVIVGIAVGLGWVADADSAAAQSWITEILGGIISSLGAASVWGRVMAVTEVKPEVLPTSKPTDPPAQA